MKAISYADRFHHFIFLDYEGLHNLLSPSQLKTILEQINNFLVFTIAVRSGEFHFKRKYLLENYLRLARSYPNLSFCIVAGHPTYSSVNVKLPVVQAFHNVFTRIRRMTSLEVFLGIENLSTELIKQIIQQYKHIIPFILHGDPRAVRSGGLAPPLAVYSPLAHSIPDEEAIKPLLGYLLRRKATQYALKQKGYYFFTPPINKNFWDELLPGIKTILRSSFHRFVLTSQNFHSRMEAFLQNGIQLVVGNPVPTEHLFKIIQNFHFKIAPSLITWNKSSMIPKLITLDSHSEIKTLLK